MASRYRTNNSTNVRVFHVRSKIVTALLSGAHFAAPGLARQVIKNMFFSPTRKPLTPLQEKFLGQADPFQIKVHSRTIHGWRWGHGPGILFIHGWNGRAAQFHTFIKAAVTSGFSAIAIDGPAHGSSEGKTTSYFEFTDMVRTLLKSTNGFQINGIVAHSFGAAAVVTSLAKENLMIKTALIAPALKIDEVLTRTFAFYGVPKPIFTHLINDFETRYGYDLNRDSPYRLLPQLTSPVLLVHDTSDHTIPYQDSVCASAQNPWVTLHTTEGLGHSQVLADPKVIKTALHYLGAS